MISDTTISGDDLNIENEKDGSKSYTIIGTKSLEKGRGFGETSLIADINLPI